MIVYQLGPIDVWFGWTPLADVIALAAKPIEERVDWCHFEVAELKGALAHAQRLARRMWWDGKLRQGDGGPYFCPLPENSFAPRLFLLAWKMDNNGTTYIAAPHRLAWLDDDDGVDWVEDGERTDNESPNMKNSIFSSFSE
jgi:hypothetical protein